MPELVAGQRRHTDLCRLGPGKIDFAGTRAGLGAEVCRGTGELRSHCAVRLAHHARHRAGDELDADRFGVELPAKVGYAPAALGAFLTRLEARNGAQAERNGLFASHPETKERIAKIRQLSASAKSAARRFTCSTSCGI